MNLTHIPDRYVALGAEYPGLALCRVSLQEKGLYHILSAEGEQPATVSGRFQYVAATVSDYPAVGDYVMADLNGGDTAVIHHVLPRKSVFLRRAAGAAKTEQVVAANVDTAFLCMALNSDFNLRRLERYLTVARESGAAPVVLLTKSDLCGDLPEKLAQAESVAAGADIVTVSAMEDEGYNRLADYLVKGETLAFVGSSGVGKSTLINRLLGEDRLRTNGLRNDDKGRHTTTHRELLILPCGAAVIDTPGMRELGIWNASEGITATFADIEALAEKCRFKNCTHSTEPGCAVRAAIERGELSGERLSSYEKLRKENAYSEDAAGYLAAKEEKFRKIAKINKVHQRN
ncbi:MAG: ribosome small subunit-dependent GTPase A [Fretibacterium sp.]|nr:ribosome small subunit-dependent GTPase A [Fretibacterium sp.]